MTGSDESQHVIAFSLHGGDTWTSQAPYKPRTGYQLTVDAPPSGIALDDATPTTGLEEAPVVAIETTVLPPGSHNPFPTAPEGAPVDRARELFVTDPIRIYYTTEEVGAQLVETLGQAVASGALPGLRTEDLQLRSLGAELADGLEPPDYSVVVTGVGQSLPSVPVWRQRHVAVIEFTPGLTVAQLIQQILTQWADRQDRPVGDVLYLEHRGGRLGIYV